MSGGDGCNLERPHLPWGATGFIIPCQRVFKNIIDKNRYQEVRWFVSSANWCSLKESKKAFNDPSGHNVICICLLQGRLTARKPLGQRGNLLERGLQSEMLSDVEGRACVMKVGR